MNKMIKHFVLFIILFFSTQSTIAQKKSVEIKKQAELAFERGDYETTIVRINEMESIFKQMPFYYLSMRIKAIATIISKIPGLDFQRIVSARKFISDYLKNPNVKEQDASYNEILDINNILESYPKDESSYIIFKDKFEKEAKETEIRHSIIKLQTEKLQPYLKVINLNTLRLGYISDNEFETVLNNAKNKYQEEVIEVEIREELKAKRIGILTPYSNYVSSDDYLKLGDLSKYEFDKILKAAKESAIRETPKPLFSPFASLGFQSGEIAKYGLLYEIGGRRTIGFHISARTSNTSGDEILNGSGIANKTEVDLGPSFKIFNSKRFYLNIGVGYGYYNKPLRNDYAGTLSLEKTEYLLVTSGLMIRISRVININGGVSFMDVDKAFYKPEIIFGISFNLKKN